MVCILRIIFSLFLITATTNTAFASEKPIVEIKTNMGTIIVELEPQRAPTTVNNFLYYVKKKFYDNTIFHRVIPNFMIQGGGFDVNLEEKPTRAPIKNESNNGLRNDKGTIAMARTDDVDSASSQFYINLKDNRQLNATFKRLGYTVFGNVLEGMDVVEKIAHVPVLMIPNVGQNVPQEQVLIESIRLLEKQSETTNSTSVTDSKPNTENKTKEKN